MYEKNKIINNKKFFKIYLLIKYKKIHYFEKNRYYLYRKTAVKCKKNIFFIKNKPFVFKGSRRQ